MKEEHLAEASKSGSVRRRAKGIAIPRRTPSVVVIPRQPVYITPDKTTCDECSCFPKEAPYTKPVKLKPCLRSPPTLYEMAADAVDSLGCPGAFAWSVEEVSEWMSTVVGLPQYKHCILDNHIDGRRLLMLEDPSRLPEINVHDFEHITTITGHVRRLYGVEPPRFRRSVGLPPRKPLTHCTWFHSRSGPSWGKRRTWTRCDVLRWMSIIMPAPIHRDHWDLVWYMDPDYPKVKFARIPKRPYEDNIPRYKPTEDVCREYQVRRKFKLIPGTSNTMIWMERRPTPVKADSDRQKTEKIKKTKPQETRLMPKPVSLMGLRGKDLILARRKMAKPKFLA